MVHVKRVVSHSGHEQTRSVERNMLIQAITIENFRTHFPLLHPVTLFS
jgi:hypothetical protein